MFVVQFLHMLEVAGVADQMLLHFAFALAVGRLLVVEERPLVVVGDVVVVVLVFAFVELFVVVCVESGVVVLAPHPLRHHYLQTQQVDLFLFGLVCRIAFQMSLFLPFLLGRFVQISSIIQIFSLSFLLNLFLSGLVLTDMLLLEDIIERDEEISEVVHVEHPIFAFRLLLVDILDQLLQVEVLLDDLIHEEIAGLVFATHGNPLAVVPEDAFQGEGVGLEGGDLLVAEHHDVLAAVEVGGEVVDALLDDVVDDVEQFGLLGLVVPGLVGDFQLQEDVLVEVLDLGVEVAVVHAVAGEVLDGVGDDVVEAQQLHQQRHLPLQLLLPLAQLLRGVLRVVVVDAVLLAVRDDLEVADDLLHSFEEDGQNGASEGLVEVGHCLAVLVDDVSHDFGVGLSVDLAEFIQSGDVQDELPRYLLPDLVERRQFSILHVETDDSVQDEEQGFCESLGELKDRVVLDARVALAMLLVVLEVGVALLGEGVEVHPPPVEVGEAGGEAGLEGGVVEDGGPEVLEVDVEEVVEVGDDLAAGGLADLVVDEGRVERLGGQQWYELGLVHVRLVHQLLLGYHLLLLHRLLFLLHASLPFSSHQHLSKIQQYSRSSALQIAPLFGQR